MTRQQLRPFWFGLSAGAAMTVIAAASFFASSETVLRSSFAKALTHATAPTQMVASANPISGSEDYWLTAMRRDDSAPMTKTISVGDEITLTLSGHRRTFSVATVSDFAPQITEIDTSAGPEHFVLVTARDVKDPNARPIRFVMEIDRANATIVGGRAGRSL
ncbi:MAG TPA: hypothetical protein VHC71_11580 [Hyphomicrobium sp.]|jgi:hypothetical protein|nr:hypothetical protein [Hyphomicrobium sp.]